MAVEPSLLTRQRILAAKVETTTGTNATLAAGNALYNAFDHEMKLDTEMVDRRGQSALSRLPAVRGGMAGTYTFKTHLTGQGGSTPTDSTAQVLLPACGLVYAAGVVSPQTGSASYTSLTMGLYQDGLLFQLVGCTGKVKFMFKSGQPVVCEWEFKGAWETPTDVALLTPTYPTLIPPRFASATFTLGGASHKISELEIDIDNEITMREDATKASGFHSSTVTDRNIKVTLDPEHTLLATKDWWAVHAAHTEAALAISLGSVANNTIAFAAPKLQVLKPELGDRDGILINKLECQANRSASAGDDEMTITFS
jgi:hypothetical protein